MSITCPNVPDTVPVALGNVVQGQTAAQFAAQFAGKYKTPTASFSAHYNGRTLAFTKNVPFTYDAPLLAALVAQSAPIV